MVLPSSALPLASCRRYLLLSGSSRPFLHLRRPSTGTVAAPEASEEKAAPRQPLPFNCCLLVGAQPLQCRW